MQRAQRILAPIGGAILLSYGRGPARPPASFSASGENALRRIHCLEGLWVGLAPTGMPLRRTVCRPGAVDAAAASSQAALHQTGRTPSILRQSKNRKGSSGGSIVAKGTGSFSAKHIEDGCFRQRPNLKKFHSFMIHPHVITGKSQSLTILSKYVRAVS